jgi:DNA-binding LytR/AlgR family response regulator
MNHKEYRCLIIDDEPIARKIIKNYVDQIPNLACVGEFKNALEALSYLNDDSNIDIVFLDINMPNLSGISMAKILPINTQIVFTTAYPEYAVESYELNAADYLLKPFLFERFAKAVFKVIERLKIQMSDTVHIEPSEQMLFVKSDGATYPIPTSEIMYCEAMKNYTKVVLVSGKSYYPLIPISKFEEELLLLSKHFFRVHRSYLVSKNHLSAIGSNYVMIEKNRIPIGSQYREAFFSQIGVKRSLIRSKTS